MEAHYCDECPCYLKKENIHYPHWFKQGLWHSYQWKWTSNNKMKILFSFQFPALYTGLYRVLLILVTVSLLLLCICFSFNFTAKNILFFVFFFFCFNFSVRPAFCVFHSNSLKIHCFQMIVMLLDFLVT